MAASTTTATGNGQIIFRRMHWYGHHRKTGNEQAGNREGENMLLLKLLFTRHIL